MLDGVSGTSRTSSTREVPKKAAVLLNAYGDPGQLRYEDTDMPDYGEKEVLVRACATSINPVDLKIRRGSAKARMPSDPGT